MKKLILIVGLFILLLGLTSCRNVSGDQTGPEIKDIQTSGNVLVISDCQGTSVTITAKVTDPSGAVEVLLWYRIGSDQKFTSIPMDLHNDMYEVSIQGSDFLGKAYGTLEFYITAKDEKGNSSKSGVDQSIQFLPCVNSYWGIKFNC